MQEHNAHDYLRRDFKTEQALYTRTHKSGKLIAEFWSEWDSSKESFGHNPQMYGGLVD